MMEAPHQKKPENTDVVPTKDLPPAMYIVACFSLAIVFTLAGLSKFGITSDGLFISHEEMLTHYSNIAPKINQHAGTELESEILRHAIGYFELACMFLLISPLRFIGVIMGLFLSALVVGFHVLLEDYSASFMVHCGIFVACVYAIVASTEKKSDEKAE
mmetsp:Transcript_32031/g.46170  ORF Transcript_32031/g.46170 Transcript_32031/m.46170 type:complete len:159 (+) Transcript_32031:100-576(+)|eukprot:CAMPEP_0201092696 /NCGR_PEP_ID=MMETSP0812-20130820/1273_1 /ASSEMBLY_ACC=CAM_ASM_000668 /TAXON_ID=98059 /ORGANISM="Dinobryon sp., Strain UTEXLB2267" /LENGTH=158 /DNA_ID=CAMNT_0047344439 /DNA_START=36 /DNA_END=512 /DNA_ORIENTATION=+